MCACVLPEHVGLLSAITTGNDQPFTLKSQQSFFIIPTISGGTRRQTHTPSYIAGALHSPSAAPHSEPCHQMPVRMQNKRLLAWSMGVLAPTGHKPPDVTPHLPEKAERARVIAFSSLCAETQMQDTGNSMISQPRPILPLPLFQLFPFASLLTSTPFKPPFLLLSLLACRNLRRVEMKLIGSQCRSV